MALMEWKIWVLILEGVFLILWAQHCYAKYKEYRTESMI